MKKMIPVLAFAALLASCGGGQTIERSKDTLILRLEANPVTLNPVSAVDGYANEVFSFMFDSLIELNSNIEPIPCIAKSWDWTEKTVEGEKKYILTFHLRDDVYWHDGVKFTAQDMVFTYEKIMDPASKALNKIAAFEGIVDSVEAPDDYTLVVTYNTPYAPAVLSWGITPLPKHLYEQYKTPEEFLASPYNRMPVGTGPYRIVRWETAKIIELERVTNYWREPPHFQKIIFKIVADDNVALAAFKRGDFDVFVLSADQYENEKDEPYFTNRYQLFRYLSYGYSQIAWNCGSNSIFADRRVRQAMTCAIDRYSIVSNIYHNLAVVVSGPFLYSTWAYNMDVPPYPFDLDKAKSLLTEAGWTDSDGDGILDKDGKKLEFELTLGDTPNGKAVALNLKENLAKLGGIVNLRILEWSALSQRLDEHNFDGLLFAWTLGADQDAYDMWHSSQIANGLNFCNYSNPELDRLLEQGRAEFDIRKRAEIYHRIHRIVAEDEPYTFLFTLKRTTAGVRELKGVQVTWFDILGFYPGYFNWYKEETASE